MAPGHQARRILVVDDQTAFAESLQLVFEAQAGVEWVGTAASGEQAVQTAREGRPDVVVMDLDLPGIDGIEATAQILAQSDHVRVVILTGLADATLLARAASAGAHAFLLKDSSVDEILEAALFGTAGDRIDADGAQARALMNGLEDSAYDADPLTHRELEVLGLLAEGRQPKEIARMLGISVHTCRGYVKNVLGKLGVHSALEAVVLANRVGLIKLPSD